VLNVLTHTGFASAGDCDTFPAFRDLVQATQPTVSVVTLPLAGMSCLAAVRDLRQAAPACEVVVLSHYDQLQVAAVEAGARALVPEDDPRALRAVMLAIAAEQAAAPSPDLPEQRAQAVSLALDSGPATRTASG
jgi:DNA-binding NarL/FixJ family response regulator